MDNQELYLVETLEWCVYAFYIFDRERINKDYLIDSKLAMLILQSVWKVTCGTLALYWPRKLMLERDIQWTTYSTTDNYKEGNGCEGYNSNILIPADFQPSSTIDTTI